MISKRFRCIYETNKGERYMFSKTGFRTAVERYKEKKKTTEGTKILMKDIYSGLSDKVGVSEEAIKNWYNGNNGPGDINAVKSIASFLETEHMNLLEPERKGDSMNEIILNQVSSENENEVIKSILDDVIELICTYGPSFNFEYIPYTRDDGEEYYEKWYDKISLKLNTHRWSITQENYDKLFSLLNEIHYFVIRHLRVRRWSEVEPMFEHIFCSREYDDDSIDWEEYASSLNETDQAYFNSEIEGIIFDGWEINYITTILGRGIGKWFLNVLKHDFNALFV